eukprot:1146057-Pelagomonas_calceolata.AAC.2
MQWQACKHPQQSKHSVCAQIVLDVAGLTALLSQCVSFSLIDVGRVSSAYIVSPTIKKKVWRMLSCLENVCRICYAGIVRLAGV